jgi:hypothetical protein
MESMVLDAQVERHQASAVERATAMLHVPGR